MNEHKQKPPELCVAELFPLAYGNEEETGMLTDHGTGYKEPYKLNKDLAKHIPRDLHGHGNFLTNGFKVYPGGTEEPDLDGGATNLERATPECSTIDELAARIQASEQLAIAIAESYAQIESAAEGDTVNVRLQRRVVDTAGNRKGCHDNFAVNPEFIDARTSNYKSDGIFLGKTVLGHLATRSFITGAGYVTPTRLRYAQKVGGLRETHGYGYYGTLYRSATEEGTPRLEVRSNDINISDWAVRMRLGSTALAIAVSATPLGDELPRLARNNEYWLEAKQRNKLELNPDGTITANEKLRESVEFQKHLAELALFELEQYTGPMPEEHYDTAEQLLFYCNDFEKIIAGEADISLLADRADWAAKFTYIQQELQADQAMGISRSLTDIKSQAQDLQYDHIGIKAIDGKLSRPKIGRGYKLRDKGRFRDRVSPRDARHAYYHAPGTTRAALRSQVLKEQDDIISCNWTTVKYRIDGLAHSVHMPNVRDTVLREDIPRKRDDKRI